MATHIDANASLISKRSTSAERKPCAGKRFRDRLDRCQTGRRRVDADRRPRRARWPARAGPRRSLATASTAAPSLAPQALPAVIENPSISGCSGLQRRQLLDAGVTPRMLVDLEGAVRRLDRHDLFFEAPLVDGLRSPCGASRAPIRPSPARLTPALTAAFQPTVIDMSMLGASGRSGWVGGNQSTISSPARRWKRGDVDAEFTPPAMTSWSMPGADAGRCALHGGLACGAVPVHRQGPAPTSARR